MSRWLPVVHMPALRLNDLLTARKRFSQASSPLTNLARSRLSSDERLCNCSDNAQRASWFSKSTILHPLTHRSSRLQLCLLPGAGYYRTRSLLPGASNKREEGNPLAIFLFLIHVKMQRDGGFWRMHMDEMGSTGSAGSHPKSGALAKSAVITCPACSALLPSQHPSSSGSGVGPVCLHSARAPRLAEKN